MSILFEKLYAEKTQHPSPHKTAIVRKPAAAEPKQENRRPTLFAGRAAAI